MSRMSNLNKVCFIDRLIWVFQDRYRLLAVKEADNRYLELIFICSKNVKIGEKMLNNTNT